jgi:primosomal protein N' (replication factor Y) (superfamily II helicase)
LTAASFARVAIESPLPQLDRLFDYEIPGELKDACQVGVRVQVPFGRGGTIHEGFVVELASSTDFTASPIAAVTSPVAVLPPEIFRLLRAIADRQAGTVSDLLKLAIPKRSVRVEKAWVEANTNASVVAPNVSLEFAGKPAHFDGRLSALAEPRLINATFAGITVAKNQSLQLQGWIALFAAAALSNLSQGKSTVVVVPDFRDQERLRAAFAQLELSDFVASFETTQTPSARYSAYLKCLLKNPTIVIGSRSAAYAPVSNLGSILIWDDADQSLTEPTSPYIHSREVALLRQQQTGCNLLLAGHSRSAECQRLIEIGYLTDATANFAPPKIAVTEPGLRVDSTSFQVARQALESGGAVLVQVANTGHSTGTYCAACGSRSKCTTCNGPLFIDTTGTPRCRWCSALNLATECSDCGQGKVRHGLAGSTRTASELGKSFPGVAVVEATFEKRVQHLKAGKRLVVATPGAEPFIDGGYAAVILLDGQKLLGKDTLRATEQAINLWSNAVSLLAPGGTAVGVGLATPIGQKFALWDQRSLAAHELANRRELGFPPHFRMASITGPRALVDQVVADLDPKSFSGKEGGFEILGPLAQDAQPGSAAPASIAEPLWRYLIRYDYTLGEGLATELKARSLLINAGNKTVSLKSGRTSRAVRVKMDDSEVI